MYPGFHRAYAERLAWRARALLALVVLLLGVWHPLGPFVSLFAFLLPARPFEERALREIARRHGLAYQTALEYQDPPLWAAARRVEARLPPFPWGLLGLYLGLLLLAFALRSHPTPSFSPPWVPTVFEAPAGKEGRKLPLKPPPNEKLEGRPGPSEVQNQGTEEPLGKATPEKKRFSEDETRAKKAGEQGAAKRSPGPSPQGVQEAPGPRSDEKAGQRPGQGAAPPLLPPPLQAPEGPQAPLPLGPGGEAGTPALPTPWPKGPPQRVLRSAEVYLEKAEPPPEVRELIRRYFAP